MRQEGPAEEGDSRNVFRFGGENLFRNDLSKRELKKYYDKFFAQTEFDNPDEEVAQRFLRTLLKKARVPTGAAVLDVGCATGFYAEQFRRLGYRAFGLDISSVAITKGASNYNRLPLLVGDAGALPIKRASLDVLFMSGCSLANTSDIASIRKFIESLMDHVRDHGVLIFVGGSNLTGEFPTQSEWIHHRYSEILNFVDREALNVEGPYITAVKLAGMIGRLSLTKTLSLALRLLGIKKTWSIIYFVRKKGAGSSLRSK